MTFGFKTWLASMILLATVQFSLADDPQPELPSPTPPAAAQASPPQLPPPVAAPPAPAEAPALPPAAASAAELPPIISPPAPANGTLKLEGAKIGTGTLTLPGININSAETNVEKSAANEKDKKLEMTVKFTAEAGNMQVEIVEKQIELETKYGKLTIPLSEIRRMELMQRILPDSQKKIDDAIKNLGSDVFISREKAQKDLEQLKDAPYAALMTAAKSTDQETRSRATALVNKIHQSWPPNFKLRENDLVVTGDSSICGKITNQTIKVKTKQFGEQQLQLAEIKSLGTKNSAASIAGVQPDPGTLDRFANNLVVGQQMVYRVTGNTNGTIYGTDIYPLGSPLAACCVHAGVLQAGETGIVRVTIVGPTPSFVGTARNGVTSLGYHEPSQYPVTFRVERVEVE